MIAIEAAAKLWMPSRRSQIQAEFSWPNHLHQAYLSDAIASYNGFSKRVTSRDHIVWIDGQPYGAPHPDSTLDFDRYLPVCEKFAIAAILANLRGHVPGLLAGETSLYFKVVELNSTAADVLKLSSGIWKLGQSRRSEAWLEIQSVQMIRDMPELVDPS